MSCLAFPSLSRKYSALFPRFKPCLLELAVMDIVSGAKWDFKVVTLMLHSQAQARSPQSGVIFPGDKHLHYK